MIEKLRNGNIVSITLFTVVMLTLMFIIKNITTHKDIVIVTATEEFIVDSYNLDEKKECVYFVYGDNVKTICGDFEIIE